MAAAGDFSPDVSWRRVIVLDAGTLSGSGRTAGSRSYSNWGKTKPKNDFFIIAQPLKRGTAS